MAKPSKLKLWIAGARVRTLPLESLEQLAEALLDFQGVDDLEAWLHAAR